MVQTTRVTVRVPHRYVDDLDLDVAYRESEQSGSSVSDVTDGVDGAR